MGWTFDGPVFDEDGFRSEGCAERSPGGAKDQTSKTLTGHTDRVYQPVIASQTSQVFSNIGDILDAGRRSSENIR